MAEYAKGTTVDPGQSRAEIESVLARYGATSFGYATEDTGEQSRAMVSFIARGRQIRFLMTMPSRTAKEFTHTPERGTRRTADAAYKAWEQACRQRRRTIPPISPLSRATPNSLSTTTARTGPRDHDRGTTADPTPPRP